MPRPSTAFRLVLGVGLVLTMAMLATPSPLAAQESDASQATLEAAELGVSLARIKNKLERLPETAEARDLLKLNFYVEVYARAPQLDYFQGFDLHNSPIPHGPPVHDDLLSVMRSGQPRVYPPAVTFPILGWSWR